MTDAYEPSRQNEEVRKNSEAFKELLPSLIAQNLTGQYALMKDGEIKHILRDFHDALIMGNELYEDKYFSVQPIVYEPINLGAYSYRHKK